MSNENLSKREAVPVQLNPAACSHPPCALKYIEERDTIGFQVNEITSVYYCDICFFTWNTLAFSIYRETRKDIFSNITSPEEVPPQLLRTFGMVYLSEETEDVVSSLELRLTGYKNAAKSLESPARADTELQEQLEAIEDRIAQLTMEIDELKNEDYKNLKKARFDSKGVKFRQGDTLILLLDRVQNWGHSVFNREEVVISLQTSHKLEVETSKGTALLVDDPHRGHEPSYLLVIPGTEDRMTACFPIDSVLVLSARSSEEDVEG